MLTITTTGPTTTLDAPFHPETATAAKAIGGKWDGKTWTFAARDEQRVRDLARQIWGTDGTPSSTVTVKIRLGNMAYEQAIWFAGHRLAHRPSRDERVRLGEGVIITHGSFQQSGGSSKNPRLGGHEQESVMLEVRDVPAAHPELDTQHPHMTVEVIGQDEPADATDALLAERERLLARIAEIDAILPEPEGTEVTTRQAAAALGVSVRTVQRWAQTGKVEATKTGTGAWVITITTGTES